jgi:hypothetical protein
MRRLAYGDQTLWPEHCVQATAGAGLRAIDANDALSDAWAGMNAAEVWRIQSAEILG